MLPQFTPAEIARFWSRVDQSDPDGCWPWTLSTRRAGYGQVSFRGQRYGAPRLAYALTYGPFPDDLDCLHRCDNPRCCRPDHLFVGTAADNVADMVRKGRYRGVLPARRHGTGHHGAKLSDEQVYAIRARADGGESYSSIAREFSMSQSMVSLIARRRNWRHLPERPSAQERPAVHHFVRAAQTTELVIALAAADDERPHCALCGSSLHPAQTGQPIPYILTHKDPGVALLRACGSCAQSRWPAMWQAWEYLRTVGR